MTKNLSFRSIAAMLSLGVALLAAVSAYNPVAIYGIGNYNDESALSQLSP
ncbi:MAG: hypothetical protein NFCOHLIN_00213 [Gammaproteobacteria bacterium]|nr:hypothetical protein [Gammaproteobacteria bacterium]